MHKKYTLALLGILLLAAYFRFVGINWDQHAHLHPDERFLTMVATNIRWPQTIWQYLDTHNSPLNPQNNDFSFYVYGTYPVILTKFVAQLLSYDTYNGITLVGRVLSGTADLFTLLIIFAIGRYLTQKPMIGILAAFSYAVAVLPIQLSHYFTVDPYATLFLTLTLWCIITKRFNSLLGISLALAVGAKISSFVYVPIVIVAFILTWFTRQTTRSTNAYRFHLFIHGFLSLLGFFLTLRFVYPYLFDGWHINKLILANWHELASFDTPQTTFPPSLQWNHVSVFQPMWQLFILGVGTVLGLIAASGILQSIVNLVSGRREKTHPAYRYGLCILLSWVVFAVGYQSIQFAKPLRYVWPTYPAIAVLCAVFLYDLFSFLIKRFRFGRLMNIGIGMLLLFWPVAFTSIYRNPTTRVTASRWIYDNVPEGKTIAWETWDDPLPLNIDNRSPMAYKTLQLPDFDPDSPVKWQKIRGILSQTDYVVFSSNRGYGAIGQVQDRYPETYHYYRSLFDGSLGFVPVAQFTSRPRIPLPFVRLCVPLPGLTYGKLALPLVSCRQDGITFIDDFADETFTVYDHPTVTIFKKIHPVDYSSILEKYR